MKTFIVTIHEETYSDNSRTFGVLLNYSKDNTIKESLVYIFNHKDKRYIFFETIINMIDYLLYGEDNMKRAYIEENDFDFYYDNGIENNSLKNTLNWI